MAKSEASADLAQLLDSSISLVKNDASANSALFRHRKAHITSLFKGASEIQKGLEGEGIDLGVLERARLVFGNRPFTPVANALDDALHDYLSKAYDGIGGGRAFEQCYAEHAVEQLTQRIHKQTGVNYWENKVSVLETHRDVLAAAWAKHGPSATIVNQTNEVDLKLRNAERELKTARKPLPTIAQQFTQAATAIDNMINIVQNPSSDLRAQFLDLTAVTCNTDRDLIVAALSSLSPPPPPATIDNLDRFLRKVARVQEDICASSEAGESLRGNPRLLVKCSAFYACDYDALSRAATLLRQLAADSKLEADAGEATLPLADSPVPLEGKPPASVTSASAEMKPVPPRMTWVTLPAIEAIEGSRATALLVPIALLSLPPRFTLNFIAEKTPLPCNPKGTRFVAENAKIDMLWLLDSFMDDTVKPFWPARNCPFRAELNPATLNRLIRNAEHAARLLRGERIERGSDMQPESSQGAFSPGVKLIEKESGVCVYGGEEEDGDCSEDCSDGVEEKDGDCSEDCSDGVAEKFIVEYTYKLTLDNGNVHQHVERWPNNGCCTQAECEEYYADLGNEKQARAEACKKLKRLQHHAAREAAAAEEKRWREVAGNLLRNSEPCDSKDTSRMALSNAARKLCQISVYFDVEGGTKIKGGPMPSSTYNAWKDDYRRKADHRRTAKSKARDTVCRAPVQLDCKMDLEHQKDSSRHVSDHSKALKVLKDIAARAGLAVAQMAYTVEAPPGSRAKGKRTTERSNFIPIYDTTQLFKVADAVNEALGDSGKPERAVGAKRKRAAA